MSSSFPGTNPLTSVPDEHLLYELLKRSSTARNKSEDYGASLLLWNHNFLNYAPFKYKPLAKMGKKIRLLRIKEGPETDTVKCELFTVTFCEKHLPIDESGREVRYEALSWCWGVENEDYGITIKEGGKSYVRKVTRELALALRYLRLKDKPRDLWIDYLCINQADFSERNHQVQMMSLIYTRATQVCVWLGEDNRESQKAIAFIQDKILNLKDFDSVSSDKDNADNWRCLLTLMQRPWFSRRWVVQEIALAQTATVHCGWDKIKWVDFAVAVELFVEVESATHRLSEVMQKDPKYYHVPGWFEHVSQLGASLLVQATAKVFRPYKALPPNSKEMQKQTNGGPNGEGSDTTANDAGADTDAKDRRGLLSLEYLVSTLSTFKASEPRDIIYSLLAVAKDTSPFAELSALDNQEHSRSDDEDKELLLRSTFSSFMEAKPFVVDYARPYTDVCKDFIAFCVERSRASDPIRALDILCRPWAPIPGDQWTPMKQFQKDINEQTPHKKKTRISPENTRWLAKKRERRLQIEDDEAFTDTLKYDKDLERDPRNQKYTPLPDNRTAKKYLKDAYELWQKQIKPEAQKRESEKRTQVKDHFFPPEQVKHHLFAQTGVHDDAKQSNTKIEGVPDLDMPSWVADIAGAAFALYHHPGMGHIEKVGRKNADSLVGLPREGQRNYSAAQTKTPDMKTLRFRKRQKCGHYSLYVTGFILDEVKEVTGHSQLGAIDISWAKVGGWHEIENPKVEGKSEDQESDRLAPPEAFWRTLVADRGKDNRNPPYYYAKACKESFIKGGIRSGSVNTTALIQTEQNSIIAEFCRRVQAVIWNRSLIKTRGGKKKDEKLGLVNQNVKEGDLVCILYGCTVPVILRRHKKKSDTNSSTVLSDFEAERFEDQVEALKSVIRKMEQRCIRRHQRYPIWKRNDSSCKSSLNTASEKEKEKYFDRLQKKELRETKIRNPELYAEEVKEETKAINAKIKKWKGYQREEEEFRKALKRMRQDDIERVERQKARRKHYFAEVMDGWRAAQIQEATETQPQSSGGIPDDQEHSGQEGQTSSDAQNGIDPFTGNSRDGANKGVPISEDEGFSRWQHRFDEMNMWMEKEPDSRDIPDFYYTFLGESYIHGMMDGEAVKWQFHNLADVEKESREKNDDSPDYYVEKIFELR